MCSSRFCCPSACDQSHACKTKHVVVQVGSGKSSLLAALLGELQPLYNSSSSLPEASSQTGPQSSSEHGTIPIAKGAEAASAGTAAMLKGTGPVMKGTVAYCSQVPWVDAGTIRVRSSPWLLPSNLLHLSTCCSTYHMIDTCAEVLQTAMSDFASSDGHSPHHCDCSTAIYVNLCTANSYIGAQSLQAITGSQKVRQQSYAILLRLTFPLVTEVLPTRARALQLAALHDVIILICIEL